MEQEGIGSDYSTTSQKEHSTPDSSWGRFMHLLFPPQLWQNGIFVGIIAWFILTPLLFTFAGLYAGAKILAVGYRMVTDKENEPTENKLS
jgi:hypothetical protein